MENSPRDKLVTLAGSASVLVALTLIVLKTWAWLATDSIAMLSSLADSLLDLIASTLTLIAVRFAMAPADREHRFGHGKAEAVAGLAQSIIIAGSCAYVAIRAVERLLVPVQVDRPVIGTAVMLTSIVFTFALVGIQHAVVRRTGSIAIQADSIHYRVDLLTNLGVLAAIGASAWLGWHLADPLFGLIVVVLLLNSVRQILGQALDILLDRELPADVRAKILEIARAHAEVKGVHDLRTRTSSTSEFIQLHLELEPALTLEAAHVITEQVEAAVRRELPGAEVIIHADPHGYDEPRDVF